MPNTLIAELYAAAQERLSRASATLDTLREPSATQLQQAAAELRDVLMALQQIQAAQEQRAQPWVAHTLHENERRYHQLLEAAIEGIWVIDAHGRTIFVNQRMADMLGYQIAEMLDRPVFDFLDAATQAEAHASIERRRAGIAEQIESRLRHRDGRTIWVLVSTSPIIDPHDGSYDGSLGMFIDISQSKQAEQALRRQTDRLQILHAIDLAILRAHSIEAIATAALRQLRQVVPSSHASVVLFESLHAPASLLSTDIGQQDGCLHQIPYLPSELPGIEVLQRGQMLAIADLAALPSGSPLLAALLASGARALVAVPIMDAEALLGGLILLSETAEVTSSEHHDLLRQVADQLALAIQNAQLFEQVRQGRQRMQTLSRQLIDVQETERRRIARELHDEIGQSLTALKIDLQSIQRQAPALEERLDDSIAIVEATLQQTRSLSLTLRPAMLDDLGLSAALRGYLDQLGQRATFRIQLDADPLEQRLPLEIETVCFRIVQESLTNIVRHAQARSVWVTLRVHAREIQLTIRDDGVGFDVAAALARATQGQSLGLLSMHERVLLVGGRMTIESTPQQGATVAASFPISRAAPLERRTRGSRP